MNELLILSLFNCKRWQSSLSGLEERLRNILSGNQQQGVDNDENSVTMVSHSLIQSGLGFTNVVGEIRNDSPNNTIMKVFVSGKFYDSNGQLVHLANAGVITPYNLRPGEKPLFHRHN
ncbi:MAG: hypothetical protein M3298_07425 [Thermoproteota archaeon]|nr:hypothetical protein [Thermoproteota archaeon]